MCRSARPVAAFSGSIIRLREDLRAYTAEGHELLLAARVKRRGRTHRYPARLGGPDGPEVWITAKRPGSGEWLVTASSRAGRNPLLAYRNRWRIECLFGNARTRGPNLEDTRLTDPRKLDLLMGLVARALAWAGRMATDTLAPRAPGRKAHGFHAKSWFRTGFERIRQLLRTDPIEAIRPWWRSTGKRPKQTRVV